MDAETDFDNRIPAGHAAFFNSFPYTTFEHSSDEVNASALAEPRVRRMLDVTLLAEDAEFSRRFPAERWARVRIALRDGRTLASEPARARGNPENPLADDELRAKYRELAVPALGADRATRIEGAVATLASTPASLATLINELLRPID